MPSQQISKGQPSCGFPSNCITVAPRGARLTPHRAIGYKPPAVSSSSRWVGPSRSVIQQVKSGRTYRLL
ncbi:hypothetical protein PGT21_015169 [Puccinia graminis f. sp. tritici]|uniref:Uncharacterized protein n=1 Tax=Puccinia graminis f. sp. tritici TaxID=56615 RepID=A0A5B0LM23_PUCGR|nr:hypothetical protein PGTUg99_018896 [Puccinia graminis f. sp. tritici]KAA1090836.1 hypothetical protein PGT21_015169 [Puccinia graminis f. sp. tritici]